MVCGVVDAVVDGGSYGGWCVVRCGCVSSFSAWYVGWCYGGWWILWWMVCGTVWVVGSLAPGICWVVLWWVVHGVVDAAMVDGVWCSG